MSAWYSNILTNTTSRISNLRSTILGGEADGDTEDDTHVCRVLRAYYTEKARAFPAWLPPDPKAPPPVVATPVAAYGNQVGARYGGLNTPAAASGGALSSLWDAGGPAQNAAPPASLRQPRLGAAAAASTARLSPFSRNSDPAVGDLPPAQARPLPSQRLGSYQSTQSAPPSSASSGSLGGGGGIAQNKLRNMFGGAGSRSNSPAAAVADPYGRPAYNSASSYGPGGGSSGGGGGGGGGQPAARGPPRRPVGGGLPSGPRQR